MLEFDPKVAHLLRRATLGPTIDEIQSASDAGLDTTLEKMLAQLGEPLSKQQIAAQAIGGVFLKDGKSLRAGWMLRLLNSPNLFREKLTLFWHNHFATAISKVENPPMMALQIDTLRELALGNFRQILLAVARDPAMLVWLDNGLNVKGHANENFGRELMELFTLGIGNYTEKDVQEVARAFTGWNLQAGRYQFIADKHDEGEKTILGKTGKLNGDDVIEILASSDHTAAFLSRKLWRFFVSQDPTDKDLAPMIKAYKESNCEIAPVMKAMFTSPRFFDADVIGAQIKNPVEFVVGTVRALKASSEPQPYADAAAAMGMDLYNPPDVSGWAGGENWISTFTLLERIRLVRQLVGQGGAGHIAGLDVNKIITDNFLSTNEEIADHFLTQFLQRQAPAKLRATMLTFLTAGTRGGAVIKLPSEQREEKIRGLVRLILCSPEYQLC
ncbi:MAG TPA: DUF1800 domain-containing protein [Tepidisphaeraceae bacterium]|jgi:uncharacterized protein (DUF1800 family)